MLTGSTTNPHDIRRLEAAMRTGPRDIAVALCPDMPPDAFEFDDEANLVWLGYDAFTMVEHEWLAKLAERN